ncbi:bifunctional precorrin-2 dehydrogenase/sirohydrochlorin ferrochelatase [Methanoculleus sp.]|mgnify:CR=1 FL=1|uniref:precorrin-2 dehydrogenase/sirohydrochlorin ferrochelatase family protein n=1 Tax=Methanoculleus sp. TaxID=90427 RepID=UPI00261490CB|nr:bifunctional precorrin-2 dehydrogenase/sirohydrochlorin ferrochelatase [Methanoculleus sp.]MDI6866468.1 bifunctional precorrin-2 dehydrogenase/sirohydrochlorin ferrochelatase [Methanoculleus sp.]
MLDLTGRRVLIFGGGDVGARKAAYFEHEAEVTVISRSFSPRLDALLVRREEVDLASLPDEAIGELLDGAFLAVAATPDPALNNRIGRLCAAAGILFNNAAGEPGDVIIPSLVRGRNYLLAISTRGKSPAVSRYLRMRLESEYANLDRMIDLQEEIRSTLREIEPVQAERSRTLWKILLDDEIWEALATDYGRARELAISRYLHV